MKALELAKMLMDYPTCDVKIHNENGDDLICISSQNNRRHEPVVVLKGPNDDLLGVISNLDMMDLSDDYDIDAIVDQMIKMRIPYGIAEYYSLDREILDAYFKAIILQSKYNLLIKDYDIDDPRVYFQDGKYLPRERYTRMICKLNVNINIVYNAFLHLRIHPDDINYYDLAYPRSDFDFDEYYVKYHNTNKSE